MTAKPWCPLFKILFCVHQTLMRISLNKLIRVMLMNQYMLSVLILPLLKINSNNNSQVKLGMIYLNTFNQLMIKITATQPAPSPQPYTSLRWGVGGICMVCIRPTYNLKSHLSTNFRINERWPSKFKIHKSKINKGSLLQRTWRIF